MNRRVILLNLLMLAMAGVLVWTLRVHWLSDQRHERDTLARAARERAVLAPPAAEPPRPVAPAEYIDVAQKTLFSKDRNPNVLVEVKPPPPKPPLPPLPAYYGQMDLGDPVILLSEGAGAQKKYHVGEKVGKFELLAFNHETITLGFENEKIEKKVEELRPKEQVQQPVAGSSSAAPPPPVFQQSAGPQARSLSSAPAADTTEKNPSLGADYGSGFRACVPGETSPAGTVLNGYKKVVSQTVMGQNCHWEQVK